MGQVILAGLLHHGHFIRSLSRAYSPKLLVGEKMQKFICNTDSKLDTHPAREFHPLLPDALDCRYLINFLDYIEECLMDMSVGSDNCL